jgi:NADPH-dependent glutamate synthase beta subunit-like oxidoreductase
MQKSTTLDRAMAEASRCLLCHDAPCSQGCPASTKPGTFIRKMRFLNLKGAIATIKENNPFGGVCGVVCPSGTLCKQKCSATGLDRPIDIDMIQRFLVEHGWEIGFNPLTPGAPNGKKVAIIGSGPAGLACAADLAVAGFAVTVFEKMPQPGGMMRYGIPDHRLSVDFVEREIKDITDLGVELRCNTEIASQADVDGLLAKGYSAVFIATGSWQSVAGGLAQRRYENLYDAFAFLRLAKEDKAGFTTKVAGKTVAVFGGGDTAMDAAMSAKLAGAADVLLVYRRSLLEMPSSEEEKQVALASGIDFVILTMPTGYLAEGDRITAVKVVRTRMGAPDESGRRRPQPIPCSEHPIDVDVVVEAFGLKPQDGIKAFGGLRFTGQNLIIVDPDTGLAAKDTVYAGGDAVRGPSIVVQAVADGKRAARAIVEKLGAAAEGRA